MWSDDNADLLKKMWADGKSHKAIGKVLGISKNAVIGKAHRLKLPSRKTVVVRRASVAGNSKRIINNPFANRLKVRAPSLPGAPLPDMRQPLAGALMLPLLDLESHHCRFPHDTDKGLRFCGCTSVPGTSWCPDHLSLVSAVPVRPRPALVLEAAE